MINEIMPYRFAAVRANASRKRKAPGAPNARRSRRVRPASRNTRRRVLSKTITRRKKSNQSHPTQDYTKINVQRGRKIRQTLKGAWKYIRSNVEKTIYAYRAYNQFGSPWGALPIRCAQTAAGAGLFTPCQIVEITQAPNNVNGTLVNPLVGSELVFTNETDTASLSWNTWGNLTHETSGTASTPL